MLLFWFKGYLHTSFFFSILNISHNFLFSSSSLLPSSASTSTSTPTYRVSRKKMRRSFCLISPIIYIWKVGSIALSGVQKLFCTIFGSRDISKSKLGIGFQNVWILDNLSVLKSDVPYCFIFISASLYLQKWVWTFSMPNKYIIFKMGYVPAF